jgi:hypothetical protein
MEVVWVLLVLLGIGAIVYGSAFLIETAWQKRGNWLKAATFVSGLCLIVVIVAGGYVLYVGAGQLWEENWIALAIAVGATAFLVYFYNRKHEASHPLLMMPKDAERIVQQYGAALARGCPDGGIARYASFLQNSDDEIKQATKLFLACRIEHKALTKEIAENILGAVSALHSFVPDDQADRINEIHRNRESCGNDELWVFIRNMVSLEIREEMDNFISQVQPLNTDDSLFHQRVYTLAGLEYGPEVEKGYLKLYFDD